MMVMSPQGRLAFLQGRAMSIQNESRYIDLQYQREAPTTNVMQICYKIEPIA